MAIANTKCSVSAIFYVVKSSAMSLVTTHNLGKSFGELDVFVGLSLSIPHGARIAVVGPNGIGKTTLLRVIAGEEPPSAGTVHNARALTIGYLPQESVV